VAASALGAAAWGVGAEAAALPVAELSRLHRHFGGDASAGDNMPMPQRAPSGGTISALSVQLPALQVLETYLRRPGSSSFDVGFGSGVMMAMMLAVSPGSSHAWGADLADKIPVARKNLLSGGCPFLPLASESFTLIGGDAFEHLKRDGRKYDVVYAGCSLDPSTDQLRILLRALKPDGAAVFNLGVPGEQGMYFVADEGRTCAELMRVSFMMAESPETPPIPGQRIPLRPGALSKWIQENVYGERPAL